MIKLPAAVFAVTLLTSPSPGVTQALFYEGNFLHKKCQSVNDVDVVVCLAYVTGVVDTLTMTENRYVCVPPKSVTGGQLRDIVTKWLEDNPADRHLNASALVMLALTEAFPCTE